MCRKKRKRFFWFSSNTTAIAKLEEVIMNRLRGFCGAFWRVTVDGLSATEAANELSMKSGTVRVAKSRVLQRLRRQLGDVD